MDLTELEEAVRDMGADESQEEAFRTLMTKIGQYGEVKNRQAYMDEENYQDIMGDTFAAIVMIVSHMSIKEDIDLSTYVEDRAKELLENAQEEREAKQNMSEAMKDGDYKEVAKLMGFVDEEDGEDGLSEERKRFYQ